MVGTKIHTNKKSDLRKCKSNEKVVYGGGGFHIIKKRLQKIIKQLITIK
jgi:hypothetical protein